MGRDENKRHREKSHLLNDSYLNNILLKIRRNHPESEGIKLLEQELEAVRIENGKNLSYIAELEDEISRLKAMSPTDLSLWKFEQRRGSEIDSLRKNLEIARKDAKEWEQKYFALLTKTQ
ncbi:MAG TPA: hypothetical protein VG621_00365 [Candidatus Paceibacterota bacterium]|nr:hypothetical protein [Candidatus Paceibacterota bacterium]